MRGERRSPTETVSKIVYVCHPFSSDPPNSLTLIRKVCRSLLGEDCLPLAPRLFLPQFLDEARKRDRAMSICLRLVALVDELRVYGNPTEGMRLEIAEARRLGIPVVARDPTADSALTGAPPR